MTPGGAATFRAAKGIYMLPTSTLYALDTNVLIHDPDAPLAFEEHTVAIPMVVLEELDKLKVGKLVIAADCRQAIRLIDKLLGEADVKQVEAGVPIIRADGTASGKLRVLSHDHLGVLPASVNDNLIINQLLSVKAAHPNNRVVLVTKDINMRLKARACGLDAEDYHADRCLDEGALLSKGFHKVEGSFWDLVERVDTEHGHAGKVTHHVTLHGQFPSLYRNQYILDDLGFIAKVGFAESLNLTLYDLSKEGLLGQEVWGLKPRDIYQALSLSVLMDPDVHLVNLTGSAGSGKTILALAAAIEQTMTLKRYRRIIITRSVQGLDEDIGFLPGTEAEKMSPWLGAITDNLEALHDEDEDGDSSVEYILGKVPIQFKSLNFIRGRSFQHSLIIIDECQNLTPHQMKTIVTRAGAGSKVICLGNLAQIDTPYLSAPSSGLTYLTERFKGFARGAHITLQGVPRSELAEFAEANL